MQDSGSDRPRGFRFAIQIIFALIAIAGIGIPLILLDIFPHLPNSLVGWAILVGVGVPFWIFLEWLAGKVFSKRVGHRISQKPLSGIRIVYALGAILAFYAGIVALWKLLGPWVRAYFS